MRGRVVSNGYMGRMPNGEWRLFATEDEYVEAYMEYSNKLLKEYKLI